jgi:hypothetical protein
VLELVRLVEHADYACEYGAIQWLTDFFKSPLGVDEQDCARQFDRLTAWTTRHAIPHRDPRATIRFRHRWTTAESKIFEIFSGFLLTVFTVILHNTIRSAEKRCRTTPQNVARHTSTRRKTSTVPSTRAPGGMVVYMCGCSTQGAITMAKKKKKAAKKVAKTTKKKGHG